MKILRNTIEVDDRKISHFNYNECETFFPHYANNELIQFRNVFPTFIVSQYDYIYDAAGRRSERYHSGSAFATPDQIYYDHNDRSELTNAVASVDASYNFAYNYDDIGNRMWSVENMNETAYTANNLNQYTHLSYDLDGNLLSDGTYAFTYDAANRLKTVSTNGVLVATNYYDAKSRRVRKATPDATHTYFYDDWNLIEERVAYVNGTTTTIRYYWGKDLSGTFQGAGGVGGLLYLTIDNALYIPCYDSNGNITHYLDTFGNIVAAYTYNAFGGIIAQSGSLADTIRHHFSTKYFDAESGLYYYGYRFYHPVLMRWFNRDPFEEEGGLNLYGFCHNNSLCGYDELGLEWVIERNPSKRWAIARKSSLQDTIMALADKLRLDFNEKAKWLRRNKDDPCLFEVPNVFCVYTSKSGWGDGVIAFVTQLKRKAMSDAALYQDKGFKVISHKWASSEDAFNGMWTQDGIYAISFAGHGSKYGFIADNASGSAIDPLSVHPPYHLSAVRAYSCLSSVDIPGNIILPDGTIPVSSWKTHVSKRGTFFGYSGLVNWLSQFWLEESTNEE